MNFRPKKQPPINEVTVFKTHTRNNYILYVIKTKIMSLEGVDNVETDIDISPIRFVVYTSKPVPKEEVDAIIFSFDYKNHVNSILAI